MAGPTAWVVVPIATLLFVLAAFHVVGRGGSARTLYFFGLVGVSIVVGLFALGGLARAMGNAIADPRTSVPGCEQFREQFEFQGSTQGAMGIGTLAQGEIPTPPPPPTFPPFPTFPVPTPPSIELPTPEPIPFPSIDPDLVPSPFEIQPGSFECPQTSGRSGAGVEAVQSGILFALAAGLGWANAMGARNELTGEEP